MLRTKSDCQTLLHFVESDDFPAQSEHPTWIIGHGDGAGISVEQVVKCSRETADWLHERLNTLEYLQGAHRRGGSSTSEAKQIASRENGKKSVQIKGVPDDMAYAECVSD